MVQDCLDDQPKKSILVAVVPMTLSSNDARLLVTAVSSAHHLQSSHAVPGFEPKQYYPERPTTMKTHLRRIHTIPTYDPECATRFLVFPMVDSGNHSHVHCRHLTAISCHALQLQRHQRKKRRHLVYYENNTNGWISTARSIGVCT